MPQKPLPIGIDDFEEIIEKDYYYVDKTWFIKELLDKTGKVNLFTRPRRFGKTLNLSMLKYYFENPIDGKSRASLFNGMKIMEAGEKYTSMQGQYPVIMLTLKSAKQMTFDLAYAKLKETIANEFYRHRNIVDQIENEKRREKFIALRDEEAPMSDYLTSLAFLSDCLYEAYQHKVIILIDEYDVPLENAYYSGFYPEMISFIRSLFESALKTNPYLEFSVITGCLRISRESIFTGLNNLKIISILNEDYGEYFGFAEEEVREMLRFYGREHKMDTMKEWYDGYCFGNTEVYNPWSVINYTDHLCTNENAFPTAAWSNTSSNSIVKDLIYHASEETRREIEALTNGASIEKKVHEDITYKVNSDEVRREGALGHDEIHKSEENLWNFLFFTGYLKKVSMRMMEDDIYVEFAIPNREVRSIYHNKIENWFQDQVKTSDLSVIYDAMLSGKADIFAEELEKQLQSTISYMDSKEAFYHGFLLGLLANLSGYLRKSNREAGLGRYDICVYSYNVRKAPVILELKVAERYKELDMVCEEALRQITEKKYDFDLAEEGYTEVICYGIAFFNKQVRVQAERRRIEV